MNKNFVQDIYKALHLLSQTWDFRYCHGNMDNWKQAKNFKFC